MPPPVRLTPGTVVPLLAGSPGPLPQWWDRNTTKPDPRYCSYLVVIPSQATDISVTLVAWVPSPAPDDLWYDKGHWGDPVDSSVVPFQFWSPVPVFLLVPRRPGGAGSPFAEEARP